jgi:effector-binding domain-containing protein
VTYTIHVAQVDSRPLAVVRRRALPAELSRVVPEACGLVFGLVRGRNIQGVGRHVALYLDKAINLEVGVEVAAPFEGDGTLLCSATPKGTVASTVHHGPYGRLGEAHRALHDWCQANGQGLAGPNWEIYDHWQEEWNREPSKIRTEVFYLLLPGAPG